MRGGIMSERIEKISISDADVPDWMASLREGGFSDVEIDAMLMKLNDTYLEERQGQKLDEMVSVAVRAMERMLGKLPSKEQQEKIRAAAREFVRKHNQVK